MAETIEIKQDELSERQLVTFHLNNGEFGVDIMHVREIIRLTEVTNIPQAPSYVEGVCNLRGNILPIIDGRDRLGMPRRQRDESTRVLVLDVGGKVTGIVVDRVSEVLRVNHADIEAPPAVIQDMDVDFLNGIVKLNGGKRIIMALNLSSIITIKQIEDIKQEALTVAATRTDGVLRTEIKEDQLVTFLLGQEEYAFDIMHVKEIIRVQQITAVPNVAPYIEGVLAIRDHLLPIINMRMFFGLENISINDQARIIIVDLGRMSVGFRVDKVSEVVSISHHIIEPPPLIFNDEEAGQIRGVAKLNDGKRLLMCLNATKLLPAEVVQHFTGEMTAEENVVVKQNNNVIDEEQLVTFKLGNEEFAIKITDVQEINRMTEVTHMPNAPAYIDGLVNLRGNIIPALNLRRRFGLAEKQRDDATRIIIVDVGNRKTGVVVDAVSEVLRFESSLVEATPEIVSDNLDAKYISGVGKLNGGKRMVMIIDLAQVLRIGA
ncbi:chemotaxis protein CheW [Pelosinus sp. sgz500959]|uniref:chemotaxis protein CheW n=1 Tax=Pelosinus sp. sgz500959 TaxID=3242472 RepID=UPI00366FFDAB